MNYNLSNNLDRNQAIAKFKKLLDLGSVISLCQQRKKRTIKQNKYLHVLFQIWSIEYGYTLKEGKEEVKHNCPFGTYEKKGRIFTVETSKMNTQEMTSFIEWFRNWSSKNGFYLLSSEEYLIEKTRIDREINLSKQYL